MHATTMQLTCLACLTLSSLEVDHTAVVLSLPFLAVNTSSCSMHAVCILSRLHGDIPVAVCAVESDSDVSVHLRLLKYGISGGWV